MKNIKIYLVALSALVLTLSCIAEAQAQRNNSFVSTTGTDSATCGAQTSPCRDFNAALSRTNAGGIVIALDSGIYAASNITIDKSVTLTAAPGVHAELYNNDGGERIFVNTGKNGVVVLRNLYITGPGFYAVAVGRVGTMQIENCVMDGLGIAISTPPEVGSQFFMKDTIIKNSFNVGIALDSPPDSGVLRATIDHCQFVNNTLDGLNMVGNCRVDVRDSVAAGNAGAGFRVDGGDLGLDHCESSHNRFGVIVNDTPQVVGTATVSNSFVTNNTDFGFVQLPGGAGFFHSLGNNVVRRNGQNTSGTITVISGT